MAKRYSPRSIRHSLPISVAVQNLTSEYFQSAPYESHLPWGPGEGETYSGRSLAHTLKQKQLLEHQSNLSNSLAAVADDAGFCPVISEPSITT